VGGHPSGSEKQKAVEVDFQERSVMIVRTWHGIVPLDKADGFRVHLLNTGVSEAKALPGNEGAYIYSHPQGEFEHFFMVSYWDNIDSISLFAGSNPNIAVTYPEDSKFCLISDPIVLHHEVQKMPSEFPLI
jgi:hypothetical protein